MPMNPNYIELDRRFVDFRAEGDSQQVTCSPNCYRSEVESGVLLMPDMGGNGNMGWGIPQPMLRT